MMVDHRTCQKGVFKGLLEDNYNGSFLKHFQLLLGMQAVKGIHQAALDKIGLKHEEAPSC